jgi:hypothetical protein
VGARRKGSVKIARTYPRRGLLFAATRLRWCSCGAA